MSVYRIQNKSIHRAVLAAVCAMGGLCAMNALRQNQVVAESPAASAAPQTADRSAKAIGEMSQTAQNLLAALSDEQKAKATFKFEDDERMNWHFIPKPRKGLTFKEMDAGQKELAHALLSSGLSSKGYAEAMTIMSLDQVLKVIEKPGGNVRDSELYYFSIFGDPAGKTWGWRVEGHHLSLNFTIADGKVVAAGPAFYGANPAKVLDGPRKGLRVLSVEEDMGRDLIKSLTEEQRKKAIVAEAAPKDVMTTNVRKAMMQTPAGVTYAELKPEQQKKVVELVSEYAHRLRWELAAGDLEKITAKGWDKVQFAWAGSIEPGQGHYYRIQGETFLIEYDDTQNNANHIHSVWRDLTDDFGEDMLAKHLREVKH